MGNSGFVYSFNSTDCISCGFCKFTKLKIWYKPSLFIRRETGYKIEGYRFENPNVLICPATGEALQGKVGREYGNCWTPYTKKYDWFIPLRPDIDKCINCEYRESLFTKTYMLIGTIGTKRLKHIIKYW